MTTLGNMQFFVQLKFSFRKTLSKYFWEVGILPDNSSKTEYISLAVSLSNTITLVFFIRQWSCTKYSFQHCFRYHLFFVSKLVGLLDNMEIEG